MLRDVGLWVIITCMTSLVWFVVLVLADRTFGLTQSRTPRYRFTMAVGVTAWVMAALVWDAVEIHPERPNDWFHWSAASVGTLIGSGAWAFRSQRRSG